jgi:hypothetical protein
VPLVPCLWLVGVGVGVGNRSYSSLQIANMPTLGAVLQQCTSLKELHALGNPCFPANTPALREALLATAPRALEPGFRLCLNGVEVAVGERLRALDVAGAVGVGGLTPWLPRDRVDALRLRLVLEDVEVGAREDTVALDMSHRGLASLRGLVRPCAAVCSCVRLCAAVCSCVRLLGCVAVVGGEVPSTAVDIVVRPVSVPLPYAPPPPPPHTHSGRIALPVPAPRVLERVPQRPGDA